MKFFIRFILKLAGYKLLRIKSQIEYQNPDNVETYGLYKIHYGCCRKYLTGWLNVDRDISESEGFKTAKVNLALKHPFKENTFKYGFAEDFVACITQSELIIFLYEVFRTFQKDGVLRISTPGLEGVLHKHYPDSKIETALLAKNQAYDIWGNIQFPSFSDLELIINHIGFTSIELVEFCKSKHPELANLDTRFHQVGLNTYVEITK